jgi:hypothetical protein
LGRERQSGKVPFLFCPRKRYVVVYIEMVMITKKLWTMTKPDATQIDATFLFGLGCEVEVVMPEWQDYITSNGTRCRYINENPYIKIITTCEKQEMMLKLKYGDKLLLSETTASFPEYEDVNIQYRVSNDQY